MTDLTLRDDMIRLAASTEDAQLKNALLDILEKGASRGPSRGIPRNKARLLQKALDDAENLAEEIRDMTEPRSRPYWFWHDIYVALAEANGLLVI